MEFVRVTFGDVPAAERQRVRLQLEEYCGRDTEAMLWFAAEAGHCLKRLRRRAVVWLNSDFRQHVNSNPAATVQSWAVQAKRLDGPAVRW